MEVELNYWVIFMLVILTLNIIHVNIRMGEANKLLLRALGKQQEQKVELMRIKLNIGG